MKVITLILLIPFLSLLIFPVFVSASANSEYYLVGPPQKIWDYVSGGVTPAQGGGGSGRNNGADGGGNHYNPDSVSWVRPHVADPNENCKNIQIDLVEHHVLGNTRSQWPLNLPGEADSNNIFHVYGVWRHPSAHPNAGSSTTQHFEIKEGQYQCIPDKGQGHIGQKYEPVKPKDDEFLSSEITVNEHKETGASVTLSSSNYRVGLNGQITAVIPTAVPGVSGGGSGTVGAGTQSQTSRVGTTTEVYYDPPVEQKIIAYTDMSKDWQIEIADPTFLLLPNEKRNVELKTTIPSSGAVLLSIQTTSENQTLTSPPFVVIANKNNDVFSLKEVDVGNDSTMFVFYNMTKGSVSDVTIENNQIVKLAIDPSNDGILQVRLPTAVIPSVASLVIEQNDVSNSTSITQPTLIDENQVYTTLSIPYAANTKDVTISGVDASDIQQKETLLLQNPRVVPEFGILTMFIMSILIGSVVILTSKNHCIITNS